VKKIPLLILLMIAGFVSAQAIYGTKDSFFKSIFCKKYKCELVSSNFSKNEGLNGGIWYINYVLKIPELYGNIEISTHRDKNGIMIPSASLYFPDVNVDETQEARLEMLSDFVFTIVGKKIKPSLFALNCTYALTRDGGDYKIMLQGKTVTKAPKKSVPYVLYCQTIGGGDPKTRIGNVIKFVISDDYHPR
jgi:hypothetical protein